ncbi:MAG TPA: DUF87 domain-containing protein [Trueperaceae bacterium]
MTDLDALGTFYLGAVVDDGFERTPEPLMYDASDLTTHAVIVGMTGSGKTGLGVGLIEEAALDGVPVLVVDPKGDMVNLALRFPELAAQDFAPWLDPREAEREGTDISVYAEAIASRWREGLASWNQGPERIERLRRSAGVSVYTPGSTAGTPLSVLSSFAPPPPAVMEDTVALADKLANTTASLLALVGRDLDPLGRDHLLISAVLESSWRSGAELSLAALVRAVQEPPLTRLGVMDIETVFPTPERTKLALSLNALLASPGFAAWTLGQPLDLQDILYGHDGKPRIAVITIGHLSDAERTFFLTLLFSEVVAWTRSLTGTTSLRALVYVDELFGMLPPVAEPPTKRPLLTLLKQARAFGVGLALSTQNPVDLDYKALSNAGTWFIGRLQTDRDKQRLLDGLRSASGGVDVETLGTTISSLPKRTFVVRSVHQSEPVVFQTRWAMSYLAGPMSREQIGRLADAGLVEAPLGSTGPGQEAIDHPAPPVASTALTGVAGPDVDSASQVDTSRPVLPPHLPEIFLPAGPGAEGVTYFPFLLGVADVYYHSKTHAVDEERRVALRLEPIEGPSPVEWSRAEAAKVDLEQALRTPVERSVFASLPAVSLGAKDVKGWQDLFERWLRTEGALRLFKDPGAKLTSKPGEAEKDFRLRCAQAAREARDEAIAKVRSKYAARLDTVRRRMLREEQAVSREQQQFQARAASVAGTVIGAIFGGRRSLSTTLNRASMGAKDLGDVQRAKERLEDARRQHSDLERALQAEVEALDAGTVHPEAIQLEEVVVRPTSRDIAMRFFGVAWAPHVRVDGRWTESRSSPR